MHFESIFFIFLSLENGLFQTHPPNKSGKFQIFFLNPSLSLFFLFFLRFWVKELKYLCLCNKNYSTMLEIPDYLYMKCQTQGLVKGEKLCLYPDFFGWLEKYSLHVKNESQDI